MNNQNRKKIIMFISKIFFIFLFLLFLFFCKNTLADDEIYTDDLGPSLEETQRNNGKWFITYHGGSLDENNNVSGLSSINPRTNEHFKYTDFELNEEYGWYEYNYNNVNCVVLAGATRDKLADGAQDNFRHYFKFGTRGNNFAFDIVYFKFKDGSYDDAIFPGIILDSTKQTMSPPTSIGSTVLGSNAQLLSAYMLPLKNKGDYSKANDSNLSQKQYDNSKEKGDKINGKEIAVSDDGSFVEDTKGDTIGTFILNFFSELISNIADAIQMELDSAGLGIASEKIGHITYTKEEVEKNSKLQKDLQVTKAVYDSTNEGIDPNKPIVVPDTYPIELPGYILNQAGLAEQTFSLQQDKLNIPYARMDLYTMTRTKVDITDIDFFTPNSSNKSDFWKLISKIVRRCSKIVLYITAALILTTLIWRSILLVSASYSQNPERAKKAKRRMDSLIKSVCLIFVVYFIMAMIIYFYKYISGLIMVSKDSYFVLRFTLEGIISFNTNVIGYIKFITLTTNGIARFFNSLLYLFMVILDVIWFLALIIRMLIVGLFMILAPLTAIFTYSNEAIGQEKEKKGFLHFYNWITVFATVVFIPIIVLIAERIITVMLIL